MGPSILQQSWNWLEDAHVHVELAWGWGMHRVRILLIDVEAGLQGNFELGHTRGIHRHTQRVYAGGYARHTHTRKNHNLAENCVSSGFGSFSPSQAYAGYTQVST